MPIALVGTLPVSAVNIGLAATPPALQAQVTKLQADVVGLGVALVTQTAFKAAPPDPAGFAAALAIALVPANLAAIFSSWAGLAATANADLTIDAGLVSTQLGIVAPIVADLDAGLSAGGLVGWSFAGTAAGYGNALRQATPSGYGGIAPSDEVSALIVACGSFSSWQTFSEGFETGTSADRDLGSEPSTSSLRLLGSLSGSQWNTGVAGQIARLRLIINGLRGTDAVLSGQIDVSLGAGLPDPGDVVDFGLGIDVDAALGNVSASIDLDGAIAGINADISGLLSVIGGLNAQLSAGGLSLWSYTGPAGDLGPAFQPEVARGLPGIDEPGGPAYGVVIACKSPSAWVDFGRITAT